MVFNGHRMYHILYLFNVVYYLFILKYLNKEDKNYLFNVLLDVLNIMLKKFAVFRFEEKFK